MITSWWRIEGAPTPDEWTALFAGLTLAAAVVAAAIALGQLRAHLKTEKSRSRPYVIVDFAFRSILMQVEIKNIGATAASDVVLRVDPPFESGLRDQANTLNAVFSEPEQLSMLAPGRRILYTFDRAPDYYKSKRPELYTVTATYADLPKQYRRPRHAPWRREVTRYRDTYVLDFRQWSQTTTESDYDNMNWNIAKRQEARTEKIAKSLDSLAQSAKSRSPEFSDFLVIGDVVEQSEISQEVATEHRVGVPHPESDSAESEATSSPAAAPKAANFNTSAQQVHNSTTGAADDAAPEPATSA